MVKLKEIKSTIHLEFWFGWIEYCFVGETQQTLLAQMEGLDEDQMRGLLYLTSFGNDVMIIWFVIFLPGTVNLQGSDLQT